MVVKVVPDTVYVYQSSFYMCEILGLDLLSIMKNMKKWSTIIYTIVVGMQHQYSKTLLLLLGRFYRRANKEKILLN